jgi:predicted DNA binding CopG/RHH family protein
MGLATGEKEGRFMKPKIKYSDEPMGNLKVVQDFLPPPEQLILNEDHRKITISLKRSSIDFFKRQAKKHKTSYQKMIREVLDRYASRYEKTA